jgi:hypothetical protein
LPGTRRIARIVHMFEFVAPHLSTPVVTSWVAQLEQPLGIDDDADMIEQIAALERVKRACAARQARLSVAFDSSQRNRQRARGVPADKVGRGVGEQIGLARRESPSRGVRHLREAKALVLQMPRTLAALAAGHVDEWAAGLAVSATECLTPQDRRQVDTELADRLPAMSPAQVRAAASAAAYRLDPKAVVKRNAKAVNERRVSVRPAPDCMTYLTALLPVKEGVACYAALVNAAKAANSNGDPRGGGQVMADTLVERLTHPAHANPAAAVVPTVPVATVTENGGRASEWGQPGQAGSTAAADAAADASGDAAIAPAAGDVVEIQLVMTDTALLAGGDDPALVTSEMSESNPAAGLVPASVARDIVRDAAKVFVRRLYTDPESGQLVAMESARRVFAGNLRRMLVRRDGHCRTPWCDAPIRHGDHVMAHAAGGPTSLRNGQGLCERCNQTKTMPGWQSETLDGIPGRHVVRTTTPTGHQYDSIAPPLLGSNREKAQAENMAVPRSNDPPRRLNIDQLTPDAADAWTVDESVLERELEQLIRDYRWVLCESGIGHVP